MTGKKYPSNPSSVQTALAAGDGTPTKKCHQSDIFCTVIVCPIHVLLLMQMWDLWVQLKSAYLRTYSNNSSPSSCNFYRPNHDRVSCSSRKGSFFCIGKHVE